MNEYMRKINKTTEKNSWINIRYRDDGTIKGLNCHIGNQGGLRLLVVTLLTCNSVYPMTTFPLQF